MRLRLAAIFAVTLVCLGWVVSAIDVQQAQVALAQTAWWTFGPMFMCYVGAHAFRTLRLGSLLGANVPFFPLFAINSIGFLAINVIPLRLGEFVRPALLKERHNVPFGKALAAIVMERLLDMAMLFVMLVGLTFVVQLPTEGLMVSGVDVVAAGQRLAGLVVLLGAVMGGLLVVIGEPAIALLDRIPVVGRLSGFARRFREGMQGLLRSPSRLAAVVVYTVSLWGLTLVGIGTFMWGFPGIPSSIEAVWTTWSVTLSGMTALPTPGFFGGYELFCTAALLLLGVERSLAATFAITLHLGQFVFTSGLGGYYVAKEGLGLSSLLVKPGSDS